MIKEMQTLPPARPALPCLVVCVLLADVLVVVDIELVVELIAELLVVLADVLAGVDPIVLVLEPTISAVPDESRLIFVPETVITPPGVRVVPGPRTYSVIPLETVAEKVWPFSVRAGGPPMPKTEVCPFTTTTPEAEAGSEKVVPETITCPPGVRVVPGPRTNAVDPPDTLAVIGWPLTVITAGAVMDGFEFPSTEVWPFTTTTEPVAGRLNVVPDTTAVPPGVRVALGPSMKAVDEPEITAVIGWPLTVSTGAPVGAPPPIV